MILVVSHAADGHLPLIGDRLDVARADWRLIGDLAGQPDPSELPRRRRPHSASAFVSPKEIA
jgi:hypothetical protein